MRRSPAPSIFLAAALLAVAGVASASHHEAGEQAAAETGAEAAPAPEPIPWDQAAVSALGRALANDVSGLRESSRRQPPGHVASGQAVARQRLLDRLRSIERETASLADQLEAGKGRDQTLALFARIDRDRARVAEEMRRMFLPQATIDMVQSARDSLEQLRAYYTGSTDVRPDLAGPKKGE